MITTSGALSAVFGAVFLVCFFMNEPPQAAVVPVYYERVLIGANASRSLWLDQAKVSVFAFVKHPDAVGIGITKNNKLIRL